MLDVDAVALEVGAGGLARPGAFARDAEQRSAFDTPGCFARAVPGEENRSGASAPAMSPELHGVGPQKLRTPSRRAQNLRACAPLFEKTAPAPRHEGCVGLSAGTNS
jgi:hypothetical protein